MANPTYVSGAKFLLFWYQTTDSPGLAEFVCGINSTGVNGTAAAIEAPMRDCAGTDSTVLIQRAPGVPSYEISGEGMYVGDHYADLWTTFNSRYTRHWLIKRLTGTAPAETTAETWSGEFVLTALNATFPADGQNFATLSLTLASNGAITYTPYP